MDKHVCKYCSKEFETGPSLGSHTRSHTRKLVECNICHQKFGEKQLDKHKVNCLKKEESSYKTCEKCGKDFKSYYSRFCSRSCANGHVVGEEQKLKTSKTLTGRILTDNPIKTKLSEEERRKKKEAYLFKRKDKFCSYCGLKTRSVNNQPTKNFCVPQCRESKEQISRKISSKVKGITGGYRERGGRGKGCHYKGIWLDSTWELSLVQRLDDLSIEWERDTKKHVFEYVDAEGKYRKYYPDFFIPSLDLYIEVKGYWTPETRHKMSSVKERHRHLNLLVLESLEDIQSLKI